MNNCAQIWQEYLRTSYLLHDTKNARFPWMSSLFWYVPSQTVAFFHFFKTYCIAHGPIQQPNARFLVSCNWYNVRPYPCQIWTQVVYLSFEE
jgi:hypothetical protein